MIADGHLVGDGSWTLKVFVTDTNVERTLRVKGDTHIGGVMLKLVEDLAITKDWSDHALWWPERNCWLSRTRSTLDQYGVAADDLLHFTPMHKLLKLQLPDRRYMNCVVDFSVKTFNAVMSICKEFKIRHPEELSLCRPLKSNHLKQNYQNGGSTGVVAPADTNTFIAASGRANGGSLDAGGAPLLCAPLPPPPPPPRSQSATPIGSPLHQNGTWKKSQNGTFQSNGDLSDGYLTPQNMSWEMLNGSDTSLAESPADPGHEARESMVRPKSLVEKARMNVGWLDSSLSIMEQGVREGDCLLLRFKFYTFYDLNPRIDSVRINQLYQQARWQILNEEIDCTEEEMLVFGALQLQVNLQAASGQGNDSIDGITSGMDTLNFSNTNGSMGEDEIDAALSELQAMLEGGTPSTPTDITRVPELCDNLRFVKSKRFFTLRGFKRYWFTCRDLQLRAYRHRQDTESETTAAFSVPLRGVEVTPDVNVSQARFNIKLEVPSEDGMTEMFLRCDNEEQYAQWLSALRLGSRGRTLADAAWATEAQAIRDFITLQRPAQGPTINPRDLDIRPQDYLSPKYQKKLKGKTTQRILENHSNVKELSAMEAKMQFIKAWQNLSDFGISLFVVKFMGHRKEELIGVAQNRLMKLDINTGDHQKTWRYNTMKAWNVNWKIKHMMVQFEEGNIIFSCQSADCKVIHEFIGGYIFLSMRSKEANQTLDEDLFHKLTGGWV
ncbi:unc-112-related protein-like isoform X2 [Arctopsyche grandis]|uniref:unc-112-related protein-like isoform X2 n=1 Tax=Arctopsyche grandis TaxID=121162 RepID=UPI00406D67D9